jgi:hypothetical protein
MSVTRLRRQAPEQPPTLPSSETCKANLATLDQEHSNAVTALAALEAGRKDVLLSGDDAAAERHDAETARQRRAIERCDLKRPGAIQAVAEAEQREEQERRERQQAEARAVVAAVIAEVQTGYAEPARIIAQFMRRWAEASEQARRAGVAGPDSHTRLLSPEQRIPARTASEPYACFLDENGNETQQEYPADEEGRYPDSRGIYPSGREAKRRQRVTRERVTVTEPAKVIPEQRLPALVTAVALPGITKADEPFWPPRAA